MPFMRNPASSDRISASVLLWDTAVCLSQAHEVDTNVCAPNIHTTPPVVDSVAVKFPTHYATGHHSRHGRATAETAATFDFSDDSREDAEF